MISSVTRLLPGDRGAAGETGLGSFFVGPENARLKWLVGDLAAPPRRDAPRVRLVVLCGPSGSGKTHFARGVAEWWERTRPEQRVVLANGIDLARQYADAIQLHDLEGFRRHFDTPPWLMVDDLDPLAQKWPAQQEMVRLLEVRGRHGRQTWITCRQLPQEDFLPQLTSRLAAALLLPVQPPSGATRQALLRHWLDQREVELTEPAWEYVLQHASPNLFHLQGTALSLSQLAQHQDGPLDLAQVAGWLEQAAPSVEYTVGEIVYQTARHFHLRVGDLRGKSRQSGIVQARSVAMYLARCLTGQSLEKIGHYFGGRDHTTVLHACRKVEQGRAADGPLTDCLKQITQQLKMHAGEVCASESS